ncbi:MAG: sulfur oxidation c-type cytochrome SoxX [Alphaproteobacteria bacterium]|nr:sulfur oxidation c-type cytochrome SoxX [Alphaproteobacteria bacterium]MBF0129029.1 sulfur oxidation c-type cytochrome SoxX [Alphaproteobacteria bacterium]
MFGKGAALLAVLLVLCSGAARSAEAPLPYQIVGKGVPVPLSGTPGNAENGRALVASRAGGNCLACHAAPIPEESDHGRVGPDLRGVGSRFGAAELRLRVVDPKVLHPDTMMPAFFRAEGLNEVAAPFRGQTILSAQEVEDVVAYLMTLK